MLSALGLALIAIVIADVLQTLFRPFSGSFGSDAAARLAWRTLRLLSRGRSGVLRFAGPTIMVGVILGWVATLILGWTLIYWQAMPHGFTYAQAASQNQQPGFADALYVSVVTLSTLGYGDLVPTGIGLRLLAALEAIVGFSMITACITWILSIYPVLSRRRTLAYEIALLASTAERWDLHPTRLGEHVEGVLRDLMRSLAEAHSDLQQFPHTYYFHSCPQRFELAAMLPRLVEIAHAASESQAPGLRFQADLLKEALRDLAATLARTVGGDAQRDHVDVLARYARDHGFQGRVGGRVQ